MDYCFCGIVCLMSAEHRNAEIFNPLPTIEPVIVDLQIGKVRNDRHGKPQVYLGGNGIEHLTPLNTVELRDGAIKVKMYTIDGREDVDYAEITIKTKASERTPLEVSRAIRGLGPARDMSFYTERTPVQFFFTPRGFMDIPIQGRARWLAQDPEGNFYEGLYDDNRRDSHNTAVMFGEGWTFCWIVQGSRQFKFGELCSPRFIDETPYCPTGEAGILELDPSQLTDQFKERFDYYMDGGQNSVTAA
jgi:hypothetical protein